MTYYSHSRLSGFVAAVLCAWVLSMPSAARAGSCQSIAGTIDATVISGDPVTVLGSVKGGLSGATRAVVTSQVAGEGGTVLLELVHDFVTDGRNHLTTKDTAVWTPVPGSPGVFHMATNYEITGGTGDYSGATGSFINAGIADTNTGLLTLRYAGEVCSG